MSAPSVEKGIQAIKGQIDAPVASFFSACVHCGLCAERCPTAAWDMQKSILKFPQASDYGGNIGESSCQKRKTG